MQLKYSAQFFKRQFTFLLRLGQKKEVLHYGIGNRTADGQYLLFIDYDTTPLEWVEEEIKYMQTKDCLGDVFLFKTKRGIHAICLQKMPLDEVIDLLSMTSCDKNYLNVPLFYGRRVWVLRQSNKQDEEVSYIKMLPADVNFGVRSKAHYNYLRTICDVPKKDLDHADTPFDKHEDLLFAYYHINKGDD